MTQLTFGIRMLLFFIFCICSSVYGEVGTYTAAVVEYAPFKSGNNLEDIILKNVREFESRIEEAADRDAQIIVFPEMALQGSYVINKENVDGYSTVVPHPSEKINVCRNSSTIYASHLAKLSCAANTHRMYVVVNLAEKETVNNSTFYYNTDVVFDTNGVVVARYRKINLYDEDFFTPGTELTTFKTNFGVTFGLFTCFDILFKRPALEVLNEKAVTDIIFPHAWMSETPFLVSLSAHSGYARENGVNLLSAGLNDPAMKHGGSGIFLANGTVAASYISGVRGSRLLLSKVPISTDRYKGDNCSVLSKNAQPKAGKLLAQLPTISDFVSGRENMENYSHKDLNTTQKITEVKLCSHKSDFCCNFNVTLDAQTTSNIKYKFVAFHGVRKLGNGTSGVRVCGLVACANDTIESCGERPTNSPALRFENITITVTTPKSENRDSRPASLLFDMTTVENYAYCSKEIDDKVETIMFLKEAQNSLLSFGIYGRLYDEDNNQVGPSGGASFTTACIYTLFLAAVIVLMR